jgi:hypothetical protein
MFAPDGNVILKAFFILIIENNTAVDTQPSEFPL